MPRDRALSAGLLWFAVAACLGLISAPIVLTALLIAGVAR